MFIDAEEIALRRHDDTVGEVVVHFPRRGYDFERCERVLAVVPAHAGTHTPQQTLSSAKGVRIVTDSAN